MSCQLSYVANNAYHQARLLHSAQPLQKVIDDPNTPPQHKHKLELALKAKEYAETRLHLKKTKNYSTYVELHRDYVTYIVSAAPKNELKYYTWYFPIIGHVPYKGYFTEQGARDEEKELLKEGYDTYVRGVSAYSTLGWFKDPILSSMMRYSDYDLVSTIIHETVHTTLYIKSNANFNERLASYLGDLGAQLYFEEFYPNAQKILEESRASDHDQKVFGEFISLKIKDLEKWYAENKTSPSLEQDRQLQFKNIQADFTKNISPKLKTKKYSAFASLDLNNAQLMGLKLYMNDLDDFEKLTLKFKGEFAQILKYCISLESAQDPEQALKDFIQGP